MDFPSDTGTNVFRIDDVKKIYWAFYAWKQDKREELDIALSEEPVDLEIRLHTEGALRIRGKHVLGDEHGIWSFSLSKADKEDVHQILTSGGFDCLSTGTEHASDATTALKPTTLISRSSNGVASAADPGDTGQLNTQAYVANLKPISQPETKVLVRPVFKAETVELRSKLASAISQSLCHALASESSFLQLGSNTCIDVRSLTGAAFEGMEASKATEMTTYTSFGIDWLSSGAILMTYACYDIASLARVSQLPLVDQSSIKLPLGTPIILSPSGMTGQYFGIDTMSRRDPLYQSRAELKASTSASLARAGMLVPSDSRWLRVLLGSHPDEGDSSQIQTSMNGSSITIWPAHLCLCKVSAVPVKEPCTDELIHAAVDDIPDPLANAQAWFLLGEVRRKALEVKRQKLELEALESKASEETDEEDALSDVESQVTRGITPQDVSGIYPTPPDGIRSSLPESSPNNIPNHVDLETEQNAQSMPAAVTRPYADHANGDLFDEIEMDMFTANGLTDADFSFFDDEPSPSCLEVRHDGDKMALSDGSRSGSVGMVEIAPTTLPMDDLSSMATLTQSGDGVKTTSPALGPKVPAEMSNTAFVGEIGNAIETQATSPTSAPQDNHSPMEIEHQTPSENGVRLDDIDQDHQQLQITAFDTVLFQGKCFDFDAKYALKGRYGFDLDESTNPAESRGLSFYDIEVLPQTGIPQPNESSSEGDMTTGQHGMEKILRVIADLFEVDETDEEPVHDTPVVSKDDPEFGTKEEPSSVSSHKRKRTTSEDVQHTATPNSLDPTDIECSQQILQEPCPPATELFSSTTGRETEPPSLAQFLSQTPRKPFFVGKGRAFIQLAQTLADQAVSGLGVLHRVDDRLPAEHTAKLIGSDQYIATILTSLATNAGKTSKRCSLKDFTSYGEPSNAQGNLEQIGFPQSQKMQKSTYATRHSTAAIQPMFKLQSPYTRVQRTGTSIDVCASALRFWEELSLAPSHDNKNMTAFCIYPVNFVADDTVTTFLNMIKGAYQICNLGSFELGSCPLDHAKILPPVFSNDLDGSRDLLSHVQSSCGQFGKRLGEQRLRRGNSVIFMINFYGQQHLPTLCAGFLKLFESYNLAVKQLQIDRPNDLVLRIIPCDLIYSSEKLILPSPSDYRRFALGVYDHCGPSRIDEYKRIPQYLSAPATRLAKAIPKMIDLRLTPDKSSPILQSDNCLHVAYAWNIRDRWLTASWTDNLGVVSWNACYYFSEEEGTPWQSFSDIAKEIWETTCDMMRLRSAPWRLFICKDSAAHREELDTWQALLMNHTKPSIISTFLSLDSDPVLRFPLLETHSHLSEMAANALATPGATPLPNAPSPDVGSTPTAGSIQVSTPPASNAFGDSHDADARLIDITDETWGVVMSTTLLSSSNSLLAMEHSCKPLASAYLIKRAGPRDEDGLVRIGLNFLSGQMGHKMVIKEVLGMYAGLGLLARVRGTVDEVRGLVPLHVAAARKAHAVVNATMRYGDG